MSATRAYLKGLRRPRKLRLFAAAYWQAQVAWVERHTSKGDSECLARAASEAEKMADGLTHQKVRAPGGSSYSVLWRSAGEAAATVAEVVLLHLPRKQSAALAHALFEEVFGPAAPVPIDPSWLVWEDGTVPRLARRIYEEKDWASLPILADSLEDAGCDRPELLAHLRGPGPHVRGCWALDLLLRQE